MSSLIFSIQEGSVAFGEKTVFRDITLHIRDRDRICLVGRNGSGKSTLMSIITGARELDGGERWILNGTRIGHLQQEVVPQPGQTVYDYVFEELKKSGEAELNAYKVEMVIQPLELDPVDRMDQLSGGQLRRAALARALVEEPDILLLDEPTNHLDLDVIEWLENYLKSYRGALICVSHDRAFLGAISDRIFWLDRGNIKICPRGFAHFEDWSAQLLEQEERELKNREKIVGREVEWASRGVKARRKRNIRRLELMKEARDKLKADKSAFRRMMARIDVGEMDAFEGASKIVAEFFKVSKMFAGEGRDRRILDRFSLRIQRGDRIGVIGKNGSGKTTFLRLLTGETAPDAGKVKIAHGVEFSYFDQNRRDLKSGDTVQQTLCPQGGDYIKVMGKVRHVCGYLKDFLFDPSLAGQQVGTLSGGQKNRLMLAKVLADPKSFLILDEPTNDLDMDTLDILEEILSRYPGTLIVVSHDRDFLDQTVSKILAFEGDGIVEGCIGGYDDYLRQKKEKTPSPVLAPTQRAPSVAAPRPLASPPTLKKLTYKLQYELDRLPRVLERLETEIAALEQTLADTGLYARDIAAFHHASQRLGYARQEREEAEARWLELETLRESFASGADEG